MTDIEDIWSDDEDDEMVRKTLGKPRRYVETRITEPKFTKGPWLIERKRDRFITAIGPLCAEEYAGSAWLDVTDEDACLMATAPELYAELERIDPNNPVLAKARGETE